jgi:VIT1/CCC1 family predicted Fe2+/Mn2+ transporter
LYERKGLTPTTAAQVATELTLHDAFAAHAEAEHGLNSLELTNAWHAAYASGLAFLCGAIIPLIAIIFPPVSIRIPVTIASVIVALMITGSLSAYAGGAKKRKAMLRVVIGGIIAMLVTFGIGKLFGVAGI